LPILVDREAFAIELGADAPDPYEEEVSLPPVPAKMAMSLALKLVLAQVGKGNATYLIRRSYIEITTNKRYLEDKVIRIYPVGDLVFPISNSKQFAGGMGGGFPAGIGGGFPGGIGGGFPGGIGGGFGGFVGAWAVDLVHRASAVIWCSRLRWRFRRTGLRRWLRWSWVRRRIRIPGPVHWRQLPGILQRLTRRARRYPGQRAHYSHHAHCRSRQLESAASIATVFGGFPGGGATGLPGHVRDDRIVGMLGGNGMIGAGGPPDPNVNVDPQTSNSIDFFPPAIALIVRAPSRVHTSITAASSAVAANASKQPR